MAVLNTFEIWHLRNLEGYISLLLAKKELSNPQKVREAKYIKRVIEHTEGAIKQKDLLSDNERKTLKEFLDEIQFTYQSCTEKAGDKYLCEIMGNSNWDEELIVLESRIKETFFPAIQKMSSSRASDNEQPSGKAGDTPQAAPETEQKTTPVKKLRERQWKPPKNYIGSKEIVNEHNVRRTTLQGWQERDKLKVKKDPQTQENYYPRKWFEKHLRNYEPRK